MLVFDGCKLPAKFETDAARRKIREDSKTTAIALLQAGDDGGADAMFVRGVAVTAAAAKAVFDASASAGTEVLVAIGEADAQLAHLVRSGNCDGAISEVHRPPIPAQPPSQPPKKIPATGPSRPGNVARGRLRVGPSVPDPVFECGGPLVCTGPLSRAPPRSPVKVHHCDLFRSNGSCALFWRRCRASMLLCYASRLDWVAKLPCRGRKKTSKLSPGPFPSPGPFLPGEDPFGSPGVLAIREK